MPGYLLDIAAAIQCPHAAKAMLATANVRVKASHQPVAVMGDKASVAGCPFQIPIGTGTKPQPCVTAMWLVPATRVKIMSKFALLNTSSGICQSAEQIPQGPPTVIQVQMRVKGQ